uniref:Uncharacterized protein n=1 Tax=Cacopsylla melanoneura TaxID=428564 RepID=A0A8D8UYP3_9HEMI
MTEDLHHLVLTTEVLSITGVVHLRTDIWIEVRPRVTTDPLMITGTIVVHQTTDDILKPEVEADTKTDILTEKMTNGVMIDTTMIKIASSTSYSRMDPDQKTKKEVKRRIAVETAIEAKKRDRKQNEIQ